MIGNLIIRTSLSRLPEGGLKSNMGDLLRSTVLLECIGGDFIWLTDSRGRELLGKFIHPEKVAIIEEGIEDFKFSSDLRIFNLDNYVPCTKLFATIYVLGNWNGYLWKGGNEVIPKNQLLGAIQPYSGYKLELSWQEAFIKGLGFEWYYQDYANAINKVSETIDIGLNWNVHHDWMSKSWPKLSWEELYKILTKSGKKVSWQEGLNDLNEYVNWISSCKVVITCDTLGLHLASALRKRVVALVGATGNFEYPYGRINFIKPPLRECMPCNKPICNKNHKCLDDIDVSTVIKKINDCL